MAIQGNPVKDIATQGRTTLEKLAPGDQNNEVAQKVQGFQEGIVEAKLASLELAEVQAANSLEKKFIDGFVAILQTWSR